MSLTLRLLSGEMTVHRFDAQAMLPVAVANARPLFLSRTDKELSIVCASEVVLDSVRAETGWRCLEVDGPLDFAMTGVLSGLSGALAAAGISLFAVSTFDTDYMLVKSEVLQASINALQAAGYRIQ